jgi:hypothetical protein
MDFYDVLDRVLELLQQHKRVTYRALQRQFDLDEAYLEDLKAEIIEARQLAVDEGGRVLVWTGASGTAPASTVPLLQAAPQPSAPEGFPPHDATLPTSGGTSEAERRQLTVLFCDLVDSTALARQLDPEDYREVVRAYQATCTDVIQRFDGYIAQYLGDGLLVYFGYPQAHEDDAQRAVRTGLEMLGALAPLYPVIAQLHRLLRWRPDDTPAEKLGVLEEMLTAYGLALSEVVPLLAALLSLPLPERYLPLTLTPQRQRQKILDALLAWLLTEATRPPVLFIVEDLHWIDPSTLEFLTLLIDQGPTARLLTLLTYRPEFQAPWGFRAHLTPLTLSRLSRPQATQMTMRITGGKALPLEVVEQIVTKTDGVPLFIEELTKMVLESGLLREGEERYDLTGPLPPLAIPATLHDSLMARLDRLATVKEVAQLGATIGRTFAYELLHAVSPLDEATLQHSLRQLVEAELVYQRGVSPQATYMFKHALIQDATYQSLLWSTRQQHHQRLARVLAERFPETVETQPELLAHHYTEAGLSAQAIPYWQQAGERALQRSANLEAISHLMRGLEVLSTLPESHERAQQELGLQLTLGPAVMNTRGTAAPEVERTYARACELCRQVGDTPQLFLALTFWMLGYPEQARQGIEETLVLARGLGRPFILAQMLFWSALLYQLRREPRVVLAQVEEELELCTEQGFGLYLTFGTVLRGWALAALGQWAEGIAQIREGFAAFRATGAGVFWPWFLALLAEACGQAGQIDEGRRAAEAALEALQTHEDRVYEAEVYRLKGELLLQSAAAYQEEAEENLQQALQVARRQQAKSLALRAAMSLARLWQRQEKCSEAHQLLAESYGWFTEGFDTADLQEAKALLDELS